MQYTTRDGTAISGRDFIIESTEAVFIDGESQTTIDLNIVNDEEKEFAETLQVILTSVSGKEKSY